MSEMRKPEKENKEENKDSGEKLEKAEIVKDQTERSYYYDDACGYEIYIDAGETDVDD